MKIRLMVALFLCASSLRADELTSDIARLSSRYEAVVGVSALDSVTGRKFSLRGDERFPMGSTYKLPIALTAAYQEGRHELSFDTEVTIRPKDFSPGRSPIAEEAKGKPVTLPLGTVLIFALRDSDNTASDVLLGTVGGPTKVMAYLNFIGVRGVDVSRSEKQIASDIARKGNAAYWRDPRDSATPSTYLLLLRMFDEKVHGLNAGGQQFVSDMLLHSTGGENRIRAGVPAECKVKSKSGTMPGVVNDAAIVFTPDDQHRIILTVFTKGWVKTPPAARERLIADIARLIFEDFTKR